MKTSPKGIALITEFEGFRSKAYQDVVGACFAKVPSGFRLRALSGRFLYIGHVAASS